MRHAFSQAAVGSISIARKFAVPGKGRVRLASTHHIEAAFGSQTSPQSCYSAIARSAEAHATCWCDFVVV